MKLFTRYTRLNIFAMLAVFVVGAGALFFTFRFMLIRQVDEGLEIEQDEQLQYIRQYHKLPPAVSVSDQQIAYRQVSRSVAASYRTIRQQGEDGRENFRQLSFPVYVEGRYYQFYVSAALGQTEHLLRAMALVTLITIALMMLIIYVINRNLVRRLLKPFYNTIDAVGRYSLTQRVPLRLPETPIEEFTMLNHTLNDMAARGLNDYQLMHDFTAHAAHEMQTPLAVIRGKLESLIQLPDMSEEQAMQIAGVDDSVARLTRLFNSLLLLTKIENGQFPMNELLAIDLIIDEKAEELRDVMMARHITAAYNLQPAQLSANKYLIEVLVNNLLNNAIRYNYSGGAIEIHLRQGQLIVSNTSALPMLDMGAVFRPFYRHPDSQQDGNGLGLSIVKQVCEACGIVIRYNFMNGIHSFSMIF